MDKLLLKCRWVVREEHGGIYVPVLVRHNLFTVDGLNALASAISGGYVPPVNLVLENGGSTLNQTVNIGDTLVKTNQRVDKAGDTQLVLSPGLANQETVTYSGTPTGSGPYTYTLTAPATKAHLVTELVARQVAEDDTMASVTSEIEYDPVTAPSQRAVSSSGFSQGAGQWTIQFFLSGTQALDTFVYVGLSDSNTVGEGLLHNHLVMGYVHQAGYNVEIDGNLTLANA